MEENENTVQDEMKGQCQENCTKTDNMSKEEPQENTDNGEKAEQKTEKEAETGKKQEKSGRSFFGKKVSKEEHLKTQIAELEAQKKELNDKFLHLYSEFDNYKKRTNKEKLDMLSTASEKVIVSLLPVIDDFERAIKANENLEDLQVIKDGFVLIYNKLQLLLKRFEVEEIAAKGETFDTDFHEAITHFPAQNEEDKGKVIDVTEKGYKIKNKVIRFSKVVVAN